MRPARHDDDDDDVPLSCPNDILDILIFLVNGHVMEEVRKRIKM